MIVPFPFVLLLLLTLSSSFGLHHPAFSRGQLNRRSPPPSLDRSLSFPPSNLPPYSPPSPGLQRGSSSPDSLSSELSFKSALDRSEWSDGSSAPGSPSAGSESSGRFGPFEYPSPSGSPASEISSGSGSVRWADTPEREAQDRFVFKPEKKRVFGGIARPKPLRLRIPKVGGGIAGQAGAQVQVPELAPQDRLQFTPLHQTIIDPNIKLTHPPGFALPPTHPVLYSVPLSNGGFDNTLSSPANARIKAAISALPSDPDKFVLVSMRDPSAPGGYQVYKYFNKPFTAYARSRIDYVPPLERMDTADTERTYQDRPERSEAKVRGWFRPRPIAAGGGGGGWGERMQGMMGRIRGVGGGWRERMQAMTGRIRGIGGGWRERMQAMMGRIRGVGVTRGDVQESSQRDTGWGGRMKGAMDRVRQVGSRVGDKVTNWYKSVNPTAGREVVRPVRR